MKKFKRSKKEKRASARFGLEVRKRVEEYWAARPGQWEVWRSQVAHREAQLARYGRQFDDPPKVKVPDEVYAYFAAEISEKLEVNAHGSNSEVSACDIIELEGREEGDYILSYRAWASVNPQEEWGTPPDYTRLDAARVEGELRLISFESRCKMAQDAAFFGMRGVDTGLMESPNDFDFRKLEAYINKSSPGTSSGALRNAASEKKAEAEVCLREQASSDTAAFALRNFVPSFFPIRLLYNFFLTYRGLATLGKRAYKLVKKRAPFLFRDSFWQSVIAVFALFCCAAIGAAAHRAFVDAEAGEGNVPSGDTTTEENPAFDYFTEDWELMKSAIQKVESNFDARAVNSIGASGLYQQLPIFVADVNRILRERRFVLSDRLDPGKADEMFEIYQGHYNPEKDVVKAIRLQIAGPPGYVADNAVCEWYLARVAVEMLNIKYHKHEH